MGAEEDELLDDRYEAMCLIRDDFHYYNVGINNPIAAAILTLALHVRMGLLDLRRKKNVES